MPHRHGNYYHSRIGTGLGLWIFSFSFSVTQTNTHTHAATLIGIDMFEVPYYNQMFGYSTVLDRDVKRFRGQKVEALNGVDSLCVNVMEIVTQWLD